MAEGVETASQLDLLVAAGCGFGQGYYFGRPMSAEPMTEILKKAAGESPGRRLAIAS